jgi:hypothetical protein
MNDLRRMALIALFAALPLHSAAADGPPVKTDNAATLSRSKPAYKPPLRGAPAGRIGGGTRGATERESFSLQVLAPDHVGYTTRDQPCLYWYISKTTTYPIEVTVTERHAVKPLVERILRAPEQAGIQSVCLAAHDVRLRPNVPYKWFVTLVTDAEHRSKDILAGGIIEMVNAPETLSARLKSAESGRAPFIYAEEGYWYDALWEISRMIEASPKDADLRQQRASLLEQVGLSEAAESGSR